MAAALACLTALTSCGGRSEEGSVAPRVGDAAPADVRLYLAGLGELFVVDVAREAARRIEFPALAAGDPQNLIEARGDGFVSWSGSRTTFSPLDLSEAPRSLGRSLYFLPAADESGVWLVGDPGGPRQGVIREVGVDGELLVPPTRTPRGYPAAAVEAGIVFERASELEVWDPLSDESVETIPTGGGVAGAARGRQLSICGSRRGSHLRIAEVGTDTRESVGMAANVGAVDCRAGEFSPDGQLLAVPVSISKSPMVGARSYERAPKMLAIADMKTMRLTVVPGTRVPHTYSYARWSPDGKAVLILGRDQDGARKDLVASRIVEHEINSGDTHAIDVEVGSFYDVVVTDAAGPLPRR